MPFKRHNKYLYVNRMSGVTIEHPGRRSIPGKATGFYTFGGTYP